MKFGLIPQMSYRKLSLGWQNNSDWTCDHLVHNWAKFWEYELGRKSEWSRGRGERAEAEDTARTKAWDVTVPLEYCVYIYMNMFLLFFYFLVTNRNSGEPRAYREIRFESSVIEHWKDHWTAQPSSDLKCYPHHKLDCSMDFYCILFVNLLVPHRHLQFRLQSCDKHVLLNGWASPTLVITHFLLGLLLGIVSIMKGICFPTILSERLLRMFVKKSF